MSTLPTPDAALVAADVARALAEDLGSGDVTAALLPDQADSAYLLCKQDAVIAGRPWFDATHRALDPEVRIEWHIAEGDAVTAGTVLALLHGRSRSLVSAERTSLNFLQTLSGTATTTAVTWQRWPVPARASSTPARPCPACAWRRSTRCAAAVARIIASACMTR